MIKAYLLKRTKSKSLKAQIGAVERKLLNRHQRVGVRTATLVRNIHQQVTAPATLLLAGGIVAAVLGLILLVRLAPRLGPLFAILVIAAGALLIGVEISTYNKVSELIKSDPTYSIGNGLYVGIGGGVVAVLGGLAALLHK